jgi:TetR/AcrR family transcriptional regulator of autoinduction and epiphytic fitness
MGLPDNAGLDLPHTGHWMTTNTRDKQQAAPSNRKVQGGRPTREAAAQLERRILEVAADLFARQGYAATSMEQVAEACKAGKDTIYRRYASKAVLFGALMDNFRAQVVQELNILMAPQGTPQERLKRYARALLHINLRPQLVALNRVTLGEAVPAKGVQPTPTAQDPFMLQLADLVRQAQSADVLAAGDALFIAEQLLFATSIKPLVATMLGDTRFNDESEQQAYFDQAWHLFMIGARSADDALLCKSLDQI